MNDSQIFLPYNPDDEEISFDLKDFFVQILLHWKLLLLFMLIFGALGVGFAYYRANKSAQSVSKIEDRISSARANLSEDTAVYVENLHSRYISLQEYQRFLQKSFNGYLANASEPDHYIISTSSYYLTSSIDHLDEVLPQILFSEDDYDAMREIVSEETSLAPIYKRVIITTANNSDGNNAIIVSSEETNSRSDYLFLVTLYGDSEEECIQLNEIVNQAVERTIESFRSLDSKIELNTVEQKFNKNSRDFIQRQINSSMNLITGVDTQLNNLRNNQITKLPENQLAYYNMLLEADTTNESSEAPNPRPQKKKWLMIGVLLGFFVILVYLLLKYFLDGKIKTTGEAELLFRKPTLQKICLSGKSNLFGKCADILTSRDFTPENVKVEMIAADLMLLLQKVGHQKLYLLCDTNDALVLSIANQVKEKMASNNSGLLIYLGNPAASITELESFSLSEEAVVFTELKNSRIDILNKWQDLCERYKLSLLGIVAVEKCW